MQLTTGADLDTNAEESAPTWTGTNIRLRPVAPEDLDFLYRISVDPVNGYRWRFRGAVPDRAEFARHMNDNLLVQFIVERVGTSEPVGLVSAYNANFRDGWAYLASVSSPRYVGSGALVDGLRTFITYLFAHWPFRKLYFETNEFNEPRFGTYNRLGFVEEGRFKDHHYFNGKYWDHITASLRVDDWLEVKEKHFQTKRTVSAQLSIDDFCDLLSRELGSPYEILPDSRLEDDLNLDSIGFMELSDLISNLVGNVDFDMLGEIVTVRDAFLWYTTASSFPIST